MWNLCCLPTERVVHIFILLVLLTWFVDWRFTFRCVYQVSHLHLNGVDGHVIQTTLKHKVGLHFEFELARCVSDKMFVWRVQGGGWAGLGSEDVKMHSSPYPLGAWWDFHLLDSWPWPCPHLHIVVRCLVVWSDVVWRWWQKTLGISMTRSSRFSYGKNNVILVLRTKPSHLCVVIVIRGCVGVRMNMMTDF
jgi:hypothetical protein